MGKHKTLKSYCNWWNSLACWLKVAKSWMLYDHLYWNKKYGFVKKFSALFPYSQNIFKLISKDTS